MPAILEIKARVKTGDKAEGGKRWQGRATGRPYATDVRGGFGDAQCDSGQRSQGLSETARCLPAARRKSKYEARVASHGTVEGSPERDRIAMEFESCVQQYFSHVRRHDGHSAKRK